MYHVLKVGLLIIVSATSVLLETLAGNLIILKKYIYIYILPLTQPMYYGFKWNTSPITGYYCKVFW